MKSGSNAGGGWRSEHLNVLDVLDNILNVLEIGQIE